MNPKFSSSNPKLLETLIHIISWLLIFGFPLLFMESNSVGINWMMYLRRLCAPLAFAIVFYNNYNLLYPLILFKKKTKKYILYNLLLIIIVSLLLHLCSELLSTARPPALEGLIPPPRWVFFIRDFVLMCFTAGLAIAIRMSLEWSKAEAARREAEKSRTEAELKNLRNQLNPHFLLNTLNNIYALIAFDTDKAQQAVQDLSKLLRHVLYDNQQTYVPLKQEADFIKNYVELMRIRLPQNVKLSIKINIIPDSDTLIAPLIFISLIENAFKHGISPTEDSFICIAIKEIEKGIVNCDILNSYFPKNKMDKSGSGIGLEQVSRRLNLLYPDNYEWHKGLRDGERVYFSILTIHT